MQVILFQNIAKLGMQGDVVNVANGYFRNYLGPRRIAVEATPGNLRRHEFARKKLQAEAEKQIKAAQDVGTRVAQIPIRFVMKATEDGMKLFGSVHDRDIVAKLVEAGFECERRQIIMSEAIKTVGVHTVKIRLHTHVTADVTVTVEAEGGAPAEAEQETEEKPKAEAEANDSAAPEQETEQKPEAESEAAPQE